MRDSPAKLSWRRRTAATIIVVFAVATGIYVIWTGYFAPYLRIHRLAKLQRESRTIGHQARALIVSPRQSSPSISYDSLPVVALVRRETEPMVPSLYRPLEHDVIVLTKPTVEMSGEAFLGRIDGQIEIADEKVWYKATLTPASKTSAEKETPIRVQVTACNLERVTTQIRAAPGAGREIIEYDIREISLEELAQLRSTIKTKHDSLVAKQKEVERKRKEAADAEFASKARSEFPMNHPKQFTVTFNDPAQFEEVKARGDDKLSLVRQSEGESSGGGEYMLQYMSASTKLTDWFGTEPSGRRYVIKEGKAADLSEGWHNVHIVPGEKTFSGDYRYIEDVIGVSYALDSRTNSPKISNIVASSPASRAGLQEGDLVMTISGRSVAGLPLADIYKLTSAARPTVEIQIARYPWGMFGNAQVRVFAVRREPRLVRVHVECPLRWDTAAPRASGLDAVPRKTGGDPVLTEEQARSFIRLYFEAACSGSGKSRADFFAPTVFFYVAWKQLSDVKQRLHEQETKEMPFRSFSVSEMRLEAVGVNSFDALVKVKHRLGMSDETAVAGEGRYFIRVEGAPTLLRITRLSGTEIPGWRLAKYRARISSKDLRQSAANGKPFSELAWKDNAELIREIILQDRANFEKRRTSDSDDEPSEYFQNGIAKRRDEWVASKVVIKLQGNLERLISGNALVDVEITKDEQVLIRIVD